MLRAAGPTGPRALAPGEQRCNMEHRGWGILQDAGVGRPFVGRLHAHGLRAFARGPRGSGERRGRGRQRTAARPRARGRAPSRCAAACASGSRGRRRCTAAPTFGSLGRRPAAGSRFRSGRGARRGWRGLPRRDALVLRAGVWRPAVYGDLRRLHDHLLHGPLLLLSPGAGLVERARPLGVRLVRLRGDDRGLLPLSARRRPRLVAGLLVRAPQHDAPRAAVRSTPRARRSTMRPAGGLVRAHVGAPTHGRRPLH